MRSFLLMLVFAGISSLAQAGFLSQVSSAIHQKSVITPAGQVIEAGFSPEGSGEQLVLKIIGSATRSLRMQAYSFTSASVVEALLAAKKRGVNVALVADHKNNLSENRSGKAHHALNALANAGIPVRTISIYPIHHDKSIVVDGLHVETGSYNFSEAAARKNSENVIVIWNSPELAKVYLDHWNSRWSRGIDYQPGY